MGRIIVEQRVLWTPVKDRMLLGIVIHVLSLSGLTVFCCLAYCAGPNWLPCVRSSGVDTSRERLGEKLLLVYTKKIQRIRRKGFHHLYRI